jgi:thiol-disulfide isomerase/thioredoxin
MKRAPASLAISGLALILALILALPPALPGTAAAHDAGPISGYIVPVAAGSAEDPALRPPMPAGLSVTDGSSMNLPLTHFRGQVLLINFWATWCVPCVKEMKFLDRLQGDLKGQPLTVMAVSEDRVGPIQMAKAFMEREKLTFLRPFGDPGNAAAQLLNVEGIPTSFIVDKKGRLVQKVEGPFEWDDPPIIMKFRGLLMESP